MTDSLIDDVKSLLDTDFADDRILKQIFRACQNNEVISNYERNYVRELAEKHLGKIPEIIEPQITTGTQSIQSQISSSISSKSLNSKMMLGIGGVSLVVVIAIIAAVIGTSDVTPIISETLSIETDLSSYDNKDLISISGKSDASGVVNLSIENQKNELVWAEQV